MVRLTAALISAIHDGADITTITSLIVPRRDLDQLVGLEVCERLTRLDLSDNRILTLEGIILCTNLQWLSVSGNQLKSLKGVENLTKLTVLNASRNQLTSFNEVAVLTELRAVILNDNEISTVCRLDRLVNLNTIVLSRNPIRNLGNFASKLLSLKKLSLSHCQVQVLGTSLKRCVALEELRLAHNQLSSLPLELERNGRLSILDVGTNHLRNWSDIQVLGSLHTLVNLNLRGNPLCTDDDYEEEVIKRLPQLQILDGHPLQDLHKSKGKKSKRKDMSSTHHKKSGPDSGNSEGHEGSEPKSIRKSTKNTKDLQAGEDSKDIPFADIISAPELILVPKTGVNDLKNGGMKDGRPQKKRKDDSGVVSVLDVAKGRPLGANSRKVAALLTQELEVGVGGPSTWDEPGVSVPSAHNTAQMQIENVESKPYSRWALKKKQ
ncbi:unnamed protein product [Calypogeia fissa]